MTEKFLIIVDADRYAAVLAAAFNAPPSPTSAAARHNADACALGSHSLQSRIPSPAPIAPLTKSMRSAGWPNSSIASTGASIWQP